MDEVCTTLTITKDSSKYMNPDKYPVQPPRWAAGRPADEVNQIEMVLGHASVQTTERCLGTKQDLARRALQEGFDVPRWITDPEIDTFLKTALEGSGRS